VSAGLPGPWSRPDYRRLWFATTTSQIGTQVSELAIPLAAISLLHASTFEVGVLAACGYLPIAVFGLPAGALVDRLPRRSVLIASDICRCAVLASVPILYAAGRLSLVQLLVVALLVGTFTVFFDVAYPTLLPDLVDRSELARANSRLQISEQAAAVIGPGLAGWLIGVVGAPLAVAADSLSYLGSAGFIGGIRQRGSPGQGVGPRRPMRTQIAEGIRFVVASRPLRAISLAAGIVNLFGRMLVIVVLIYLVRDVGYSATAIGIVFSIGAVGFVLGAALADRVIDRVGLGPAIVLGGCVASASFVLIAAPAPGVAGPFVALGMFVYGLGALTFTVGNATLRQLITPAELLGRVTSSTRFLVWVAQPVAGVLGGWLGTRIGLHGALWVGAIGASLGVVPLLTSGLVSLREAPAQPAA